MESPWNFKHFRKKGIVIADEFPKLLPAKNSVKALSTKRRFRTSIRSQCVNGCQTVLKSTLEHLYHIFWSLWGEMICKISPWLKLEILEVFVNTLTADDKYPFGIVRIWSSLFKCNYLKNKKIFLNFLFHLWNLHQILNIFKKKMIVIANVFPKLKTVETWLDHSLKSAVSQHPLAINMLKGRKHLWNLHQSTFFVFFDHSYWKWLGKYLLSWTLKC